MEEAEFLKREFVICLLSVCLLYLEQMLFYSGYWYRRMKTGKVLNGRWLDELVSFFYSTAIRSGLQIFGWPLDDISMFIWILPPKHWVLFFHWAARQPITIKPGSPFYPSHIWSNPSIWGSDWLKEQQTIDENEEWIKGLVRKRLAVASWHRPYRGPVMVWLLLNMALIIFSEEC